MATDATGTPTPLGIPTYNINVDAPSGNGFNAAMSEIDTLIQARAPLASPALTGTPTAPTPATADNTTKIATTAYVKAQGYLTSNAVTTVFGRTGAVVATSGDYTAAQVTNAADKSAAANQTFAGNVVAPSFITQVPAGNFSYRNFLLPGDAQPAFSLVGSGTMNWGPGGSTPVDTVLGRASAGVLQLNASPPNADNSTALATTAFVKAQGYLTSAPVASVFGRTGSVVAASGDYTAAQVTNAADKSSTSTQAFSASLSTTGSMYFSTGTGGSAIGNVTVTPDYSTGQMSIATTTGGGGTTTINNSTNNPSASQTGFFVVQLVNTGASAQAVSWGTMYRFSQVFKPTSIASNSRQIIVFVWEPNTSGWYAVGTY